MPHEEGSLHRSPDLVDRTGLEHITMARTSGRTGCIGLRSGGELGRFPKGIPTLTEKVYFERAS
jgi:hypothetical protein